MEEKQKDVILLQNGVAAAAPPLPEKQKE